MEKTGIVTFTFTKDNYGQVLQYLATQRFIDINDGDAYLIKHPAYRHGILYRIVRRLLYEVKRRIKPAKNIVSEEGAKKEIIFNQWASVTEQMEKEHPRKFDEFRNKYFKSYDGYIQDLKKDGFDSFCVGSDQTWSGASRSFFLEWVPKGMKKFSIAPSVGHKSFNEHEEVLISEWVKSFDFITVREDNGLRLMKKCNRPDAVKILDPTLLLTSEEYAKYEEEVETPKRDYIFIYLLGGEISIEVQKIIDFAKEQGLDYKYCASQGRKDEYINCYPTVSEWLSLIKNAKYVATNSFHGTAFSIIYRKPFLVFPLVGLMKGMNGRIIDITRQLSLEDRVYANTLDTLLAPVNWSKAEDVISTNKEKVTKLLSSLIA